MRIATGVMGSAGGLLDEEAFSQLATLGRTIAERGDCILTTGGYPDLPYAVVRGPSTGRCFETRRSPEAVILSAAKDPSPCRTERDCVKRNFLWPVEPLLLCHCERT